MTLSCFHEFQFSNGQVAAPVFCVVPYVKASGYLFLSLKISQSVVTLIFFKLEHYDIGFKINSNFNKIFVKISKVKLYSFNIITKYVLQLNLSLLMNLSLPRNIAKLLNICLGPIEYQLHYYYSNKSPRSVVEKKFTVTIIELFAYRGKKFGYAS